MMANLAAIFVLGENLSLWIWIANMYCFQNTRVYLHLLILNCVWQQKLTMSVVINRYCPFRPFKLIFKIFAPSNFEINGCAGSWYFMKEQMRAFSTMWMNIVYKKLLRFGLAVRDDQFWNMPRLCLISSPEDLTCQIFMTGRRL